MKISTVADVLDNEGLTAPELAVLKPDRTNYKVCLLQPKGDISYDAKGVRHKNPDPAALQFSAFLDEAIKRGADLAITPEYSMPWLTLLKALERGQTPPPGKLWALGCESITYPELIAHRENPDVAARFIFEDLSDTGEKFLDPLAYVFWTTKKNSGQDELVILIQFKTEPMSDEQQFEVNHLRTGDQIYQFGADGKNVRLTSFICSDALKIDDDIAAKVYDRSLILHIQLNPNPRHQLFRAYRDKLMNLDGDATELICLNWARAVKISSGEHCSNWTGPTNSAWYLKPKKFNHDDDPLAANHRNGLYYTYRGHDQHALFFNYEPALFILEATKAAHIAQPAIAKRTGPNLKVMLRWNGVSWAEGAPADDGFGGVVEHAGAAKDYVQKVSDHNPVWTERLLALSTGAIGHTEDWHCVKQLDSCAIDQNEIIQRMTFCQDPDSTSISFRTHRLKLCGHLISTVGTASLPASLQGMSSGYDFTWNPAQPHQNAVFDGGAAATIIYMGETVAEEEMRRTRDRVDEFLRRSIKDDRQSLLARQRLAIWYRDDNGEVRLFEQQSLLDISAPKTTSSLDVAKEE